MNAPPQLPLGDLGGPPDPDPDALAAKGRSLDPAYARLSGHTLPDQAITSVPPSSTCPTICDPVKPEAAEHTFTEIPASIISVIEMNARHVAKGFTPARDAERGPAWFWHAIHDFWWRAMDAGDDRAARRKAKVTCAALIIASIEADDFLAQQQQEPSREQQRPTRRTRTARMASTRRR